MSQKNDAGGCRPILEIRNLSISFNSLSGPIHAVRDFSLTICERETVSLLGETGCGKSTIALAILGLLYGHSQSGQILYQNREIKSFTRQDWEKIRSSGIGIVFQDARSALNPVRTILDHLTETLQAHQKLSRREARATGMELLREVGIKEDQERLYPFELSGGMCQRVGMAMAICNKPQLLIADEPTTAIDSPMQASILNLLRSLRHRYNLSLLLISHDLALISQISDRISIMYHGQIVESGSTDAVLITPAHPYTQGLLQCQPSLRHHHEDCALSAIPGTVPHADQVFTGCAFAPRCNRSQSLCYESFPGVRHLSDAHWAACIHAGSRV